MSNSENSTWRKRLQAALEVLGREHLVEQRARQRLRRFRHARVMCCSTSHSQQKFSMNWLGSSTASHSTPEMPETPSSFDLRQHVVQAMAELVEQRDHVVVREAAPAGLPSLSRRCEVADQVGDRRLHAAGGAARQRARIVHPGAAALALARVRVEVELADQLAAALRSMR